MWFVHNELCREKHWKKCLPALQLCSFSGLLHRHKNLFPFFFFFLECYVYSKKITFIEKLWFLVLYNMFFNGSGIGYKVVREALLMKSTFQLYYIYGSGTSVTIQWRSAMHIKVSSCFPELIYFPIILYSNEHQKYTFISFQIRCSTHIVVYKE